MIDAADLYDYAELREVPESTMYVVGVARPTLVLGGRQSLDVINVGRLGSTDLRRRRGGGGLVLLQPGDLWLDWWIPTGDPRWSPDVRVSALLVGGWWRDVLEQRVPGVVSVHRGALEGVLEHRVVCFAGRGPGEVFVDGRKAVGLTQWRVREGIFVSTVIHSKPSSDILRYLTSTPDGLGASLDHHLVTTLDLVNVDQVVADVREASGFATVRVVSLKAN